MSSTSLSPRWSGGLLGGGKRASIVRGQWRRDERLLQFLAFGIMFDHSVARQALDHAEEARVSWRALHGDGDLSDSELADLLTDIVDRALEPHVGAPITLGLSGGFDSRPLLHTLWKRGDKPALYNFGSVGNLDYDLVRTLQARLDLDVTVVDTNTARWSLDLFDEHSRTTADLLVSPRVLTAQVMDARYPGRIDVHGFLNGALSGGTRPPSKKMRGDDATAFAIKNDTFGLQSHLPAWVVSDALANAPVSDERGISIYRQLDIGYRQTQRIRSGPLERSPFVYPYADERWVGYWLNRPASELEHQKRWVDFVRGLDPELFFELQGLHEEGWAFNRERLRRVYGDADSPGYVDAAAAGVTLPANPKNHFSLYACYRNNESFRQMIDESIRRLRGRNIFRNGFIDFVVARFGSGDPDGMTMLNGLVSTDIAVEAGRF